MALTNSDILKAQLLEIQSGFLRTQGAGLLPNPYLALQTGKIDSGGYNGGILELGLFQTVPFPGKLGAARRFVEIQKNFTQLQGLELRRTIQHQVTLLAVQLVVLRELSKHTG